MTRAAAPPWLAVIGIGDDGLAGLDAQARRLIETAELLVGGERHQAMVPDAAAERLTWQCGFGSVLDAIAARRGRPVVVLATGDPMWFGVGATLAGRLPADEMTVLPRPGAFSLAAARMGWPLADVETLTVHGRPLDILNRFLQPGARLLVLSRDGETPAAVAALLVARGFGESTVTVLEHLGGKASGASTVSPSGGDSPRTADLNTLAIVCRAAAARLLPPVPGLPDDAFVHDGQLTKREVRAAAIAALAPLPGQTLWDVGAGAGSIAHRVAAVGATVPVGDGGEGAPTRSSTTAAAAGRSPRNAAALGVPRLVDRRGPRPAGAGRLCRRPTASFSAAACPRPGVIEACWRALPAGGRLVAHAVTMEGSARLSALWRAHGRRTRPHRRFPRRTGRPLDRLPPGDGGDAARGDQAMSGTLYGLGIGPGDPDLMTLKASDILARAPVIAYPAPEGARASSRAHRRAYLPAGRIEDRHRDADGRRSLSRRKMSTTAMRRSSATPGGRARRGRALRGRSLPLRLVHVSLRPARGRASDGRSSPASPR